jgi:hypothetical protein
VSRTQEKTLNALSAGSQRTDVEFAPRGSLFHRWSLFFYRWKAPGAGNPRRERRTRTRTRRVRSGILNLNLHGRARREGRRKKGSREKKLGREREGSLVAS